MAEVTRRVIYSGSVQGVGFRRRAASLAAGLPVAGYVRNLPDGSVELVAQGEAAAVEAFLDAVRRRLGREIADAQVTEAPPGDYAGFVIRR